MRCDRCGHILCDDEEYYDFLDGLVCEECLDKYLDEHRNVCTDEEEVPDRMESWDEYRGVK